MNEIWKDIEFTDNKYAVSNLGVVKVALKKAEKVNQVRQVSKYY